MGNKTIDGKMYLPSFLDASVVRDQTGRCWTRSGYLVIDDEITINDVELFNVESSAICCEECVSNILEDDVEDPDEEDPDVSEIDNGDDSSSSESSASDADDPSSDSSDTVIPPEEVVPEFECTPPCIEERYEETSFVTLELCLASVVSFDCDVECQTLDTDPEDNIVWISCNEKGCNQNVETGLWYIDCCCKEDTELEPIINSSSSSSSDSSDSSSSDSSSSDSSESSSSDSSDSSSSESSSSDSSSSDSSESSSSDSSSSDGFNIQIEGTGGADDGAYITLNGEIIFSSCNSSQWNLNSISVEVGDIIKITNCDSGLVGGETCWTAGNFNLTVTNDTTSYLVQYLNSDYIYCPYFYPTPPYPATPSWNPSEYDPGNHPLLATIEITANAPIFTDSNRLNGNRNIEEII